MSETEPTSFIRGEIEFSGADDPANFRGTNRLSLTSRRFSLSGIQELVAQRIREGSPKSVHIMREDRTRLTIDGSEFVKAKDSPQGRAELIESLAAVISNSRLFCIEEGQPNLEAPSASSPGGPQTLFEAR